MKVCKECDIYVSHLASHKRTNLHKSNCLIQSQFPNVQVISSAFKSRIISYRVNPMTPEFDAEIFLRSIATTVLQLVGDSLRKFMALKVNFELFASYVLPKDERKSMKSFNTQFCVVFQNTDLHSFYEQCIDTLMTKCSEFELSESGWSLDSISHLELNINQYNPLRAGTYINLPKIIQNTKACLNIKNKDNYCFLYSIMAHLYPAKSNSTRVSSYPHFKDILNISGMKFPPSLDDIKQFEMKNENISVNVYGLEKKQHVTGPLYKTAKRKLHHVNLLLLENNEVFHFCLIKKFERLVHKQLTKHKCKIFLCEECFIYFDCEQKLTTHDCARVKTILPEPNTKLKFSHVEKTQKIPIAIYGDFESLLREYSDRSKKQYVQDIQIHEASCFAYYICCASKPELNEYVSYRGPNCSKKFAECITRDVMKLYPLINAYKEMLPLTETERQSIENATVCHICKLVFKNDDTIVADHDHFTGKLRGPAHNLCNLNMQTCQFIPILFHNLSGYDCHLFITELANIAGRINLIPRTKEKYITLTKFIPIDNDNSAQLKFIDSFNFLSSSLDKLADTLDPSDFQSLKSFFPQNHLFDLLRRKGIYCYDYVDSWKRYEDCQLPDKKYFFNKLSGENISEEDYKHAQKVWQVFQIKNLGEYTDLYLMCDVLLLCDVFEKFRVMSLNSYNLDPCYYVSSPSLSWDAMLLFTKVELDLISDIEMYQMLENGIRGGLAQCSLRHAKANNVYLSDYDDNVPDSYLVYMDCVNLYGFAMMQKLPTRNFRFFKHDEIEMFNLESIPECSQKGYILEVDIEYPVNIHDEHSDLPFAPEKYAAPGKRSKKLIANLHNKYKYIIHYMHLKECLLNGLKLLKIHRILTFEQDNFLKPYIELNTFLRQKATSEFERDYFKKQNNSIFGKTIENKRKQVDVKLVNVWRDVHNLTNKICGAEKYISMPNFKNLAIFSENLVAIQLQQTKLVLDRPIYIGFSVLEIAKSHLYKFHYSVMKNLYGQDLKLCYTDTDSLLYIINTSDFYKDMKQNIQYFDTSNFEVGNVYNIPQTNIKLPGYFKDEMGGRVISEFAGLRAKLYCVNTEKTSIKKAKGIKKSVTKNLQMDKFKRCLYNNKELRDDMYIIKSKNHKIFTTKLNKLVLSRNDDKRNILTNKITTLPWGHYSTPL